MLSSRFVPDGLLGPLAAAAFALSFAILGCGSVVVVDSDGDLNGTVGGGGAGGNGIGAGSGSGGGSDTCLLGPKDGGSDQVQVLECFNMPPDGCPNQYMAVQFIVPSASCVYLVSVDCGPYVQGAQCCYVVTEEKKPCGGASLAPDLDPAAAKDGASVRL